VSQTIGSYPRECLGISRLQHASPSISAGGEACYLSTPFCEGNAEHWTRPSQEFVVVRGQLHTPCVPRENVERRELEAVDETHDLRSNACGGPKQHENRLDVEKVSRRRKNLFGKITRGTHHLLELPDRGGLDHTGNKPDFARYYRGPGGEEATRQRAVYRRKEATVEEIDSEIPLRPGFRE